MTSTRSASELNKALNELELKTPHLITPPKGKMMPSNKFANTKVAEAVDRIGRLKAEIKKRQSTYKGEREFILMQSKALGMKLLYGETYKVKISRYNRITLDSELLALVVPEKLLRKCRVKSRVVDLEVTPIHAPRKAKKT